MNNQVEATAEVLWSKFAPIRTGDDYVASLRGRDLALHMFGKRVVEPVDHPIVRPSI
jgi:4-hydroxybutyryl-CoA dehydratase/vinylacetyl-CoA-Delta-isomerase